MQRWQVSSLQACCKWKGDIFFLHIEPFFNFKQWRTYSSVSWWCRLRLQHRRTNILWILRMWSKCSRCLYSCHGLSWLDWRQGLALTVWSKFLWKNVLSLKINIKYFNKIKFTCPWIFKVSEKIFYKMCKQIFKSSNSSKKAHTSAVIYLPPLHFLTKTTFFKSLQ